LFFFTQQSNSFLFLSCSETYRCSPNERTRNASQAHVMMGRPAMGLRSQVSETDRLIQAWNERTLRDRGCLSSGERAGAADHFFQLTCRSDLSEVDCLNS
jgi:hypothetical protein